MSLFDEEIRTPSEKDIEKDIQIDRRTWLTGLVSLVGATAAGLLTPALSS